MRSTSNPSVDLKDSITRSASKSEQGDVDARRDEEQWQLLPAVSPDSSINEYALSVLPLDRGAFEILQYFLNVDTWTLREVWREEYRATTDTNDQQLSSERSFAIRPSGKLAGHKKLYFSALGQIIQGALNSPIHMYALLTMTASGMRNTAGVAIDPTHTPEYLMSKVLPNLRKEVAQIANGECLIDKQILLDIFYLFAHEWWAENYTIALTHLRILHSLLHNLDQNVPLDRYIFEGAIFDDVMVCLESGTRPLRALDWSPHDLSTAEKTEIRSKLEELRQSGTFNEPGTWSSDARFSQRRTLAIFLVPLKTDQRIAPMIVLTPNMGAGLIKAAKMFGNADMVTLLRDILFLIEVMHYTWISAAPATKYAQWATTKVHAILHVLLSMRLVGEWECVRLTMVMMLSVLSSNRAWRSGVMNASRLRAALSGSLNHLTAATAPLGDCENTDEILVTFANQRMLLWVLVVGAANAASLDRKWFVTQATKIATQLGLRNSDQLSEIQVEYLCLLRSQQTVVQELAAALEAL